LVLCRIQDETGLHKFNSWWEGPFIALKVTGPGSYRLQYPNGLGGPKLQEYRAPKPFSPLSNLYPKLSAAAQHSLLKGHRSYTSSTTPFTSSQLVLHIVYWRGLAPILPVLLRLLVLN
jgi:hypothetical protein